LVALSHIINQISHKICAINARSTNGSFVPKTNF
jgi:hypothetical protein